MSFWGELRRRNVVKVAVAYAIVGWILVQVAATLFPALQLPQWTVTLVAALIVIGFPVALLLSWAYELTPEGIKRTKEVPLAESVTHLTGNKLNYIVTALLVLAVAFMAVDNYVLNDSDAISSEPAAASAGAPAEPPIPATPETSQAAMPNSVAVLPCDNFSTDPENAFFAASLHEELLNQLFKLRNMNVIARTSVLQYAGVARPIPEIAKELRVESVMECSVAYGEGRIVISAQLIDGNTGLHIWSDRYNREFEGVFDIQADIAMNVANALRAEFSPAEQQDIEQAPTSNPTAYALYLRARNAIETPEVDREAAHSLLDRAIAIDPRFARAYGEKAMLYATALGNNTLGSGVSAEDRAALIAQVNSYGEQALAIDPQEVRARAALRSIYIPQWRWSEYRAALEPADLDTLTASNLWVFSWMGDAAEAVRLSRRIVEVNPNLPAARIGLGVVLAYDGQREEADKAFAEALRIDPTQALALHWRAINAIAAGDGDRGLRQLRTLEQLIGENRLTVFLPELAYAYSRVGQQADVERIVTELEARGDEQEVGVGTWAMASLAAGDEERALELLEAAAEKAANHDADLGLVALMNLRMNALNDPRLEEPRFVSVLARIRGD
jgi:TolB-like protein